MANKRKPGEIKKIVGSPKDDGNSSEGPRRICKLMQNAVSVGTALRHGGVQCWNLVDNHTKVMEWKCKYNYTSLVVFTFLL